MKQYFLLFLMMTQFFACKTNKELPTVATVDLTKYAGKWYEIVRLPNRFEKGLKCVTANYRLLKNNRIEVINKGITETGKEKVAKGKAHLPDLDYPGRLKVTFFWPFYGDYYILALDKAYQYVLVGEPSRRYLWILARTKKIPPTLEKQLLELAEEQGFDTSQVLKIAQTCDN